MKFQAYLEVSGGIEHGEPGATSEMLQDKDASAEYGGLQILAKSDQV